MNTQMQLPTGTITFLFTDIEGSTKLVQSLGDRFEELLADHHRLLREVFVSRGGVEVGTEGDAFFVVFTGVPSAVQAAADAQRALAAHDWRDGIQLRVRMGLHTGEGKLVGDNYGGIDVHRAARIAAAAHGGQIIVSDPTRSLVESALPDGLRLKDLGEHQLKDLDLPEHLYQLCVVGLQTDFPSPRSLDARPNNLPVHLSSFIERDRELKEIETLLREHRMVTLTGPGGTGKSRLSIAAAERLLPDLSDGVYFVSLSSVMDPDLVPSVIAETLNIHEQGTRPIAEILVENLSDKEMLLVLDNFEQILPAAALVSELLTGAPGLKILVSSRAPLRVYGEQEFPVPPMTLPDPERLPSLEVLESSEAIVLFLQRARAIKPDFRLTADNAMPIAAICYRLDGLPLAIELAVARLRLFGVQEILKRLEGSLTLLTGGSRDLPQRQQTLRDAIAWSYDLLSEAEQAFFRRLGVFRGGWTFDAAENVVMSESDMDIDPFDAMGTLVDNSLFRRIETDDGSTRFRMLETIREFAIAELEVAGELAELKERHARFFLDFAEQSEPKLTTTPDVADQIAAENDNLRAALDWAITSNRIDVGIRIGKAIWRFWQMRGHLEEGRRRMTELMSLHDDPDVLRARGLMALGSITYWQTDFEATAACYREGFELFRVLGDRTGTAEALYNLGFVYLIDREYPKARITFEESLELHSELGEELAAAYDAWGLSMAAVGEEDSATAEGIVTEAKKTFERFDDWFGSATADFVFYQIARLEGDLDKARRVMIPGIELISLGGDMVSTASLFDVMADVEIASGNHRRALRLAGAATWMKEKSGGQAPPQLLNTAGDPRELLAGILSPDEIDAAFREGLQMSFEEALAYLKKDPAAEGY